MIIKRHRTIDWEPLLIRFSLTEPARQLGDRLHAFIRNWLDNREKAPVCAQECRSKYISVNQSGLSIDVLLQWVCDECLEKLLTAIASMFPAIDSAVVGTPSASKLTANGKVRFIQIAPRDVTLEAGEKVLVDSFYVSASPISVGDYLRFCNETGYVTVGERTGQRDTFKDNGPMQGVGPELRSAMEALFLSYEDAHAYCEARALRLPTDPELLAAITLNDDVVDISDAERTRLYRTTSIAKPQGVTLTATTEGDKVIARSGPWVVKHIGWEREEYRLALGKRECVGQFFVCQRSR